MTATLLDGGWRAPEVCRAADVTYRQLDYWDRAGYVSPSVPARGSGSARLYAFDDVVAVAVVATLIDAGVGLRDAARVTRRVEGRERVRVRRGPHVAFVVDVAAIRDAMGERLAA